MEWTRALDIAAGRMFPAVALRQLIEARRRTDRIDSPQPLACRPDDRRVPLGSPALGTSAGAVR